MKSKARVIEGTIRSFNFSGVLLDREGRARVYEVTIVSAVTIRDLRENKILYDNQNFIFRDSFEFSQDPRSFFNEEDPAVERMSRAFAESVVSTIVTGVASAGLAVVVVSSSSLIACCSWRRSVCRGVAD